MRPRFLAHVSSLPAPAMYTINPKCEDPECNHRTCIKDPETGEWYKGTKIPYQPQEDELVPALLAMQIKELKSIKGMLIFFTVLSVISILYAMYIGVTLALTVG